MRSRSQNHSKVENIPTDIPKVEVNTEPNNSADIPAEQKADHSANGAEFALKHQVEALRHNEQLVREHNERLQQERLALQHGCKT
jgi:hypothetical protein